jgi:hypothetical protein
MITAPFALASRRSFASFNAAAIKDPSSTAVAILLALWAEAWLIERGIRLASRLPSLAGPIALSLGRTSLLSPRS